MLPTTSQTRESHCALSFMYSFLFCISFSFVSFFFAPSLPLSLSLTHIFTNPGNCYESRLLYLYSFVELINLLILLLLSFFCQCGQYFILVCCIFDIFFASRIFLDAGSKSFFRTLLIVISFFCYGLRN